MNITKAAPTPPAPCSFKLDAHDGMITLRCIPDPDDVLAGPAFVLDPGQARGLAKSLIMTAEQTAEQNEEEPQ